jgi:glycosyltransferase involved in cell wall biosynthesis
MVLLADTSHIERVLSPSEGFLSFTKRFGGHVLFSLLLPFTLQKIIDREKITELIIPVGPGGVLLFRRPKRCTVTAISHHSYIQQSRLVPGQYWKKVFIPFERRTICMASKVLCYTEDAQRALKKYGAQALTTTHPFDAEIWAPTCEPEKQEGLCVCIARISKRKGTDVLLKAWPKVRRSMPHARLVIVGAGKVPSYIEGVDHFNDTSLKDLIELVQRAEVAVCPSYLEGFGYACAEAMAAGTTVVASDVPGLRSLITDDKTGRLVAPGDSTALAEAIVEVLKDSSIARVFADRARKNIRQQFAKEAEKETLQHAINSL